MMQNRPLGTDKAAPEAGVIKRCEKKQEGEARRGKTAWERTRKQQEVRKLFQKGRQRESHNPNFTGFGQLNS